MPLLWRGSEFWYFAINVEFYLGYFGICKWQTFSSCSAPLYTIGPCIMLHRNDFAGVIVFLCYRWYKCSCWRTNFNKIFSLSRDMVGWQRYVKSAILQVGKKIGNSYNAAASFSSCPWKSTLLKGNFILLWKHIAKSYQFDHLAILRLNLASYFSVAWKCWSTTFSFAFSYCLINYTCLLFSFCSHCFHFIR